LKLRSYKDVVRSYSSCTIGAASSTTRGRTSSMVIISYINKSVERIREATDYELKDGTYILKDAAGKEVGQAPSRQVSEHP